MNRGFMGVCCSLLAPATIAVVFVLTVPAQAQVSAERPPGARPDGAAAPSNLRPAAVLCCGKGARRWITNIQACRRAGGRPLPESACREGRRVCCKRGVGYFWATAQSCTGRGRTVVATKVCSAPGQRICCSGRRYPRLQVTTRRRCDQIGGRPVRRRLCRTRADSLQRLTCCLTRDGNFLLTRRECGAARGRPSATTACRGAVCCERDGRRSLTRRVRCRQQGGRIVSHNRCRARGGTVRGR